MIVRFETDGSLVMITQNDHAKAAGLCASHWGNARFEKPRPFKSTMRAAFLHDLAWLQEETAPAFDHKTGRTVNYLDVPFNTQVDAHDWADDWVSSKDAYAGLLASKHRTGILKARYGLMQQPNYKTRTLDPVAEAFVARSHAKQDATAKDFDERELTANYILLQIWDLFSLYICSTERLEERSIEPVPTGYANSAVCMRLNPVAATRIAVDPFPFDQPSLDVNVVYRRLRQSTFESEQDFHAAYFKTAQQMATFTFFDPTAVSS